MNNQHLIQLFVRSECEPCDEIAHFLQVWSSSRTHVNFEVVPVLSEPELVVRLRIFETPALIIDGQLVASRHLTVGRTAELLEQL